MKTFKEIYQLRESIYRCDLCERTVDGDYEVGHGTDKYQVCDRCLTNGDLDIPEDLEAWELEDKEFNDIVRKYIKRFEPKLKSHKRKAPKKEMAQLECCDCGEPMEMAQSLVDQFPGSGWRCDNCNQGMDLENEI
jgi:predicted SprT family Zn-dependent metalloprotease